MEYVKVTPGFCPNCGSIFPPLKTTGNINCYSCKLEYKPDVFGPMEIEYTINFNTYKSSKSNFIEKKDSEHTEGPLVNRICPKCSNDKMSYSTLQLRSADEGQTIFYTCNKCSFKETENS